MTTTRDFVQALMDLRPGFTPEWSPGARGPDAALVWIAAHYLQAISQRLDQAPDKNKAAFLYLLGVRPTPPQPARTPIVIRLAEDAQDVRLTAGTGLAAPPPPGGTQQVVFETERSTGLAAARLTEVVSLWPGRDQYAEHSADAPFRTFDERLLGATPHELYLAHDLLLNLSGGSTVNVGFELTTPGSDYLDLRWEYWDGATWRGFQHMDPSCSNLGADRIDGTGGLRRSGTYHLRADYAETTRTSVDGVDAFWIRARLEDVLPPDPARVLPEVDAIRLSTETARSYAAIWRVVGEPGRPGSRQVTVLVLDAAGVPLKEVSVSVRRTGQSKSTSDTGLVNLTARAGDTIAVEVGAFTQEALVAAGESLLTFTLDMPAADQALAAGAEVDLTQPFMPFGPQPLPGVTFYFSSEEALGKPGAQLRIYLQKATGLRDSVSVGAVSHVTSWEYFNGQRWVSLLTARDKEPGAFRTTGVVDLTVPADLAATEVNGQNARWLRVRLVSGGYGIERTISVGTPATELTIFESVPPVLGDLRLGYAWQKGPMPPEHVRAYNDFRYEDKTREAVWPGDAFAPYIPTSDATPALYLGFDRALPVDTLGLLIAVAERSGDSPGPALRWEYWDGFSWNSLTTIDETRNLRVPGLVTFIGPQDSAPLTRFRASRHWLRARLEEDGPPGSAEVLAVYPNAVWATQRQTIADEALGTSMGTPSQSFPFARRPVLPGPLIEVRELAGPRAAVEWRLIAAEVLGADERMLRELEAHAGDEIRQGRLRLRRDRDGRVREIRVTWEERQNLLESDAADRHFAVDPFRGLVHFGDGEHGRVPPQGAAITAARYHTGGGLAGNLPARTISQVLGSAGAVEEVFNPFPADGGTDAETFGGLALRGPSVVHAHGRAITATDYETHTRQAFPSVATVRASVGAEPGQVRVVIVPHSAEPRPLPSFVLCEAVHRHLAAYAPANAGIVVTGPDYLPIDVSCALVPRDLTLAAAVEQDARRTITIFFAPVQALPGADVRLSDLAGELERIGGIDHLEELTLLLGGTPQGEVIRIPAGHLPTAGAVRLKVMGA